MSSTASVSAAPRRGLFSLLAAHARLYADRRAALLALAGYFLFHTMLRAWAPEALSRDELVEVAFAQAWAWGYNPEQPPLYTWMVLAAARVFGPGVIAALVVKHALLFAFYIFHYLAAARVLRDPRLAVLATASMLLVYMFGFDALGNNFTQTVALATFGAAALYYLLRIGDEGDTRAYVGFGVALGLGLLSKYNFAVFAVPLIAAAMLDPGLRRRLLDWRLALALTIALAMFVPHGIWRLANRADVSSGLVHLQLGQRPDYLAGVLAGVWSAVDGAKDWLGPWWIFWILLFPAVVFRGVPPAPERQAMRRFMERWFLGMALILLAAIVLFRVQAVKNHHLLPLLLMVPLYAVLRLADRPASTMRVQIYAGLVTLSVVTAATTMVVRPFAGPKLCPRCDLAEAYGRVSDQIRAAGFQSGTIAADAYHVAGNLRAWFPDSSVYMAHWSSFQPPSAPAPQCLIVWRAGAQDSGVPPQLAALARDRLGIDPAAMPPASYAETRRLRADGPVQRLGYVLFPEGAGRCR